MTAISIEDLERIREQERSKIFLRTGRHRARITVHMGTCGIASGASDIMTTFREEIVRRGLTDVILTSSGCAGLCAQEPMITVEVANQPPVKYIKLDSKKAVRILLEHVTGGTVVEDCVLGRGSELAVM